MRRLASGALRLLVACCAGLTLLDCGEHHAIGVTPPNSPTLLQCPTDQTQTTTSVITALGGTVSLGGTIVRIPAGALTTATSIKLTVPASQYMEIEVQANDFTSFVFQQSISITIDYSRCSASEASKSPLSVWHIDPQTKQLLENLGGTDDKSTHSITFSTSHFSGYAVSF